MNDLLFLFVGLATGLIGTLIGAGGGFLLAPLFIFLFPEMGPERLTALSLLAVAANSLSGSIGYAARKQVHWPSVLIFSITSIPGVLLGVKISQVVPRQTFELIFAVFLLCIGTFVLTRSFKKKHAEHSKHFWNRKTKIFGAFISFFVGILSSLLGIGGGIVHVPLLSEVLHYPVHLAAGTSHSILAIMSVSAVTMHFIHGDLNNLESFVPYLVIGLVVGAQAGAAFSKKAKSHWILRLLAIALLAVSIRLFLRTLGH